MNTLVLNKIYSIKQTLRPKKLRDRSLDPRKITECVNFQPKKYVWPKPFIYTASTPPPWGIEILLHSPTKEHCSESYGVSLYLQTCARNLAKVVFILTSTAK